MLINVLSVLFSALRKCANTIRPLPIVQTVQRKYNFNLFDKNSKYITEYNIILFIIRLDYSHTQHLYILHII